VFVLPSCRTTHVIHARRRSPTLPHPLWHAAPCASRPLPTHQAQSPGSSASNKWPDVEPELRAYIHNALGSPEPARVMVYMPCRPHLCTLCAYLGRRDKQRNDPTIIPFPRRSHGRSRPRPAAAPPDRPQRRRLTGGGGESGVESYTVFASYSWQPSRVRRPPPSDPVARTGRWNRFRLFSPWAWACRDAGHAWAN
jgi:hypothetical protein